MDAGCYHRLTAADGTSLLFNAVLAIGDVGAFAGAVGARLQIIDVADADFADNRLTFDLRPGLPGGNPQGGLADVLYPTLEGEIQVVASGLTEAQAKAVRVTAEKMMIAVFESMRAAGGTWYVTESDAIALYFTPVFPFGKGINFSTEPGVRKRPFVIALGVSDPRPYTV